MAPDSDSKDDVASKIARDRSPSFPFISLKAAVDRLVALEGKFGRHPAPAEKVGLAWSMKEKSSQAFQTLAALKAYGLVEYQGSNKDRQAMLTDDARTYLRAQQQEIKAGVLKSCALRPKALATYWKQWGADRPIDEVCLDQLVIKDGFTQSAAATFLRVYDDTIDFAGLSGGDGETRIGDKDDALVAETNREDSSDRQVKIGDFVCWELNGVIQFAAKRVVGLSPDGMFAFVEGSSTGLSIKELIVVSAPPNAPSGAHPSPPSPPPGAGLKQDTFSLDEGTVVLQWPSSLSQESYDDFKDWIDLQLRKIKRSIQ
ncbi:hypothetical protein [Thiomonas delicata]|uniref:Uncharacterized protein n=1 Tax=Thiomonas delicata TaxID=364030 RepID=A0A238D3X8_THIDL|nr:hypothetical protein [Thiomonas delicata]SBP88008.1 hypothetical protein THIARS_60721 [Thiomonas delicata]